MIKIALALAYLILTGATLQAGSLDDLKAAKAAAEGGKADEAVRLFTQSLRAGDLSPADRIAARKGRGSEYTSQSLIADAFVRLDQARTLRDSAIADFTNAIDAKTDDASLFVARGEAYHLNGQYDAAVADFDAALKLGDNANILMQRAISQRSKGDTDGAVAGLTAVLAMDAKETGLDKAEIHNERGYTLFLAARYDAAAADFDKALTLGSAAHTGDVLWLPYQAAWLHIARTRAGQNDSDELTRNAANIDLKQWPGTLIAYYLGQLKLNELSPPSSHGSMGRGRECNLSFFTAQQSLIKNDAADAARLFQKARAACNIHALIYLAAGVELKRLAK